MKYSFLKQLWVAIKIWVIALAVNTFAGSLYLAGYYETYFESTVIWYGLLYGAIFSLPVAIILLIIIHHCVGRRKNGLVMFQYVFIAGLFLTTVAAIFFMCLLTWIPMTLVGIALVSAVAAIGSQYYALFRLAKYDNEYENYLS